jgi:hypothetical protein
VLLDVAFWGGNPKIGWVMNSALSLSILFGTLTPLKRCSVSVQPAGGIQILTTSLLTGKSHENRIFCISSFVGCFGHHAHDRS